MRGRKWCVLLCGAYVAGLMPVEARGLRTPWGQMAVENLKIGKAYSLGELVGKPYEVINTGAEPVGVRIVVEPPREGEMVEGTERIPDVAWVEVERGDFTVGPSQIARTDIRVAVPNEEKYLGKRYLVVVEAHTVGPGAIQVGLRSRIVLAVSATRPTVDELREKLKKPEGKKLTFDISPYEGDVAEFPLGEKVDLVKEKGLKLKLINPNDEPLTFHLRPTTQLESQFPVPSGMREPPEGSVLEVAEKGIFEVAGNSLKIVPLSLFIPDAPENRGRTFYFMVRSEILEQESPTIIVFRLAVKTRD